MDKERLFEILVLLGTLEYKLEALVNEANIENDLNRLSAMSNYH